MAAGYPVHDEPPDIQHAGVVVDVKERDLVIVLSQYEEKGVHELDELGEVVPPQNMHDLRGDAAEEKRVKDINKIRKLHCKRSSKTPALIIYHTR